MLSEEEKASPRVAPRHRINSVIGRGLLSRRKLGQHELPVAIPASVHRSLARSDLPWFEVFEIGADVSFKQSKTVAIVGEVSNLFVA